MTVDYGISARYSPLESFDFKFQPSIDPKVIRELATGRFVADCAICQSRTRNAGPAWIGPSASASPGGNRRSCTIALNAS